MKGGIRLALWWESLSQIQRAFAYVAFPATIILILQTLLVLFGLGENDADSSADAGADVDVDVDVDVNIDVDVDAAAGLDLDGDGIPDSVDADAGAGSSGLALFSLRGILAFFAVGGWAGIAVAGLIDSAFLAVVCAFIAGAVALYAVALLFKYTARLQSAGNLNLRNAVGKTATVYITIPASRNGAGKVHIVFQERYSELSAVTDEETPLRTGTLVEIVGVADENTLLVAQAEEVGSGIN
jgi:membrane protein implicated in regulation of membrane protease activity